MANVTSKSSIGETGEDRLMLGLLYIHALDLLRLQGIELLL